MSASIGKLRNPPVVEAIVDFECEVQADDNLKKLQEPMRNAFRERYPKVQPKFLREMHLKTDGSGDFNSSLRSSLQAWMYTSADEKQIVQVRQSGFSFNQLAPYMGFDAYLSRIKEAWLVYRKLVEPIGLNRVSLRYINRILLPQTEVENGDFSRFLTVTPVLPKDSQLLPGGFLTQYQARDKISGQRATVALAIQPAEGDKLPIIFDNGVAMEGKWDPDDWSEQQSVLISLRKYKNRIFSETVKDACMKLFR